MYLKVINMYDIEYVTRVHPCLFYPDRFELPSLLYKTLLYREKYFSVN